MNFPDQIGIVERDMLVSVEKRHIPGHGASEPGIETVVRLRASFEDDAQGNICFLGNSAQEGSLVLYGVGNQIGQTRRHGRSPHA